MGANAVTTVPVYTAGEVLTAADMNITNSGIPVFATTTTRDAAFGGAGEKTLAEGQFAYIEATNTTQYYDGAAWQSVGQTPGFVCVKAETAFTSAATVTADNVFTSSYTNYKIIITYTGITGSSFTQQLRVGGVTATTNYDYQILDANATVLSPSRTTGASSFGFGGTAATANTVVFDFFQPNLAGATGVIAVTANTFIGNVTSIYYTGRHTTATAYDGIIFNFGSNSTGTYTIYGYGKTL